MTPDIFNILLGYTCNLSCSHCGTNSGPDKKMSLLTIEQHKEVNHAIRKLRPKKLLFTGGEPLIYISEIQTILNNLPEEYKQSVMITTNGTLLKRKGSIKRLIRALPFLSELQISYDKFHGETLTVDQFKNIREECDNYKIKLNISYCIETPQDIIDANKISNETQIFTTFQKLTKSGMSHKNGHEYKYYEFEDDVLEKSCPNKNTLSYLPDRGFSTCCSSLLFNKSDNDKVINRNLDRYLSSEFYKKINFLEFKYQIKNSVELQPHHSNPCHLCEAIHG